MQRILRQHSKDIAATVDLHKMSPRVPEFDTATLAVQSKFKKDFRSRLADVFSVDNEKAIPGLSSSLNAAPISQQFRVKPMAPFKPGDEYRIQFGGGKHSLMD